jgi:hypothetical protein
MSQNGNRLYHLLPAIYRQRDEMTGLPLQALLAVIENEFNKLESDMDAAYDNWFIETCDAWVIPYLAALVGIEDQTVFEQPLLGQRRLVANHIAYQRRKGMVSILGHITRDVSGWYAYGADLSKRVAQTPHVKNVKPSQGKTLDLRQSEQVALLGTAFDSAARSVDVRRVDAETQSRSLPGLVSPNALALYLWRTKTYPVRQAEAAPVRGQERTGRFTFDPLGRDLSLFIQPEAIDNLNEPMHPGHFPQPLTRALLQADLHETGRRTGRLDFSLEDEQASSRYYGPQREFAIWVKGRLIPASEILSGEISSANTAYWLGLMNVLMGQGEKKKKTVVVDPETGYFLLAQPAAPKEVIVNYTYGFGADLGSGPFVPAKPDAADKLARRNAVRIDILQSCVDSDPFERVQTVSSLKTALKRWQGLCDLAAGNQNDPPRAIIRFLDSGTYSLDGPLLPSLPGGSLLSIEATAGERPTIIVGPTSSEAKSVSAHGFFDRHLRLQGLLVSGPVVLPAMHGGKLDIQVHGCTFLNSLRLHIFNTTVIDLKISASILNSISVQVVGRRNLKMNRKSSLTIEDSIVRKNVSAVLREFPENETGNTETTGRESTHVYVLETGIQRSTILGDANLSTISQIRDSIVMGCLNVEKTAEQPGVIMQYSYAAVTNLFKSSRAHCVTGARIQPTFTSTRPAHPGYAQLRLNCPVQIRNGASNGAEMGAFNLLQENRREANLKRMLPDYLPLGQKIGLFKVT